MTDKPPFAFQAAKASWMAPLLAIALGIAGMAMLPIHPGMEEEAVHTARIGKTVIGFIAFAIVLVGVVFGILALFGIRKHGAKGILAPSIMGLLLSSGYIYLLISAILLVQRIAQQHGPPPH
jgi:hypothetical protein